MHFVPATEATSRCLETGGALERRYPKRREGVLVLEWGPRLVHAETGRSFDVGVRRQCESAAGPR